MGYYTRYKLEWDLPENWPAIAYYISQHEDEFGVDEDGAPLDECKWYEHEATMRALSKAFPLVTFILSGEGEEQPDMWKQRWKNGEVEYSRVLEVYTPWSKTDPGRRAAEPAK